MAERQYIFTTTRFVCGCIYRTSTDTAVFCPQHRTEWHKGTIIQQETINTPGPETPDIPGLVMNSWAPATPLTLRKTSRNSLHTMTSLLDGHSNEWADTNEELTGICAACFIDDNELLETQIAMCECGEENCSYRWCGRTEGLHAFWRLHAQGRSQETAGHAESDIFSYGIYAEQPPEIRAILDQERNYLTTQTEELITNMTAARQPALPGQDAEHQTGYLVPWLDREYKALTSSGNPKDQERAQKRLKEKLTRLHVIEAMPPPLPIQGHHPPKQPDTRRPIP